MKNDPLYSARRTLHTGAGLLIDKQASRLTALFADDAHVEVEVTWGIYQRTIAAYRHEDRRRGRESMVKLIDTISTGVPNALVEVTTLGRTLKKTRSRRAGLLRPSRHQQRPRRGDQRPARAPARFRTRVPQPHELHRQIAARDRRLQAAITPSIVKSRQTYEACVALPSISTSPPSRPRS
jgi:transposase